MFLLLAIERRFEFPDCFGKSIYFGMFTKTALGAIAMTLPAIVACSEATKAIAVAASSHSSCALFDDGHLECWGLALATPTTVVAVEVPTLSDVETFETGDFHACAIMANQKVVCMGLNDHGQLGVTMVPEKFSQVTLAELPPVLSLGLGFDHSCALIADETVQCWGNNDSGQLGQGYVRGDPSNAPAEVINLTGVSQIAAGSNHNCALLNDGRVTCWGINSLFQRGNSEATGGSPVVVENVSDVVALTAGTFHTCALLSDTTVTCWGGLAHRSRFGAPRIIRDTDGNLAGVAAIEAGGDHTCALMLDKTVKCWGAGGSGQLGNGSFDDQLTAVDVLTLTNVSALTSGGEHSCAIIDGGAVLCWGANGRGQLGDATQVAKSTPTPTR